MGKFSQRSLDTLKGVHPDMVKLMNESIKDTPVDFTVVQGVRTTEYQKELYSYGRTKINPNTGKMTKVTNSDGVKSKSNHQAKSDGYGHAVDIFPFYNGKVQTQGNEPVEKLKILQVHIKAVAKCLGIKINWGGDFKSLFDPAHFELK